MTEITGAIAEAIRKRTASATLGTYLFFWAAYHWQGLYATFFVNQDLIYGQHGLLKNEYVNKYFFPGPMDWNFYLGILIPLVLTYLFIWWMPYILLKAYRKEQWFRVEKRIIKIEQERNIQEERKELAKETTQAIKKEVEVVKAQRAAEKLDPKMAWKNEYNRLDSQEEDYLKEVLVAVYKHRGLVYVSGMYSDAPPEFELSPNALRLADSHELISIVEDGSRIELTQKGKYFASLYDGDIL